MARTLRVLCVVLGLAAASCGVARAGVIYYDDFSGSGAANLNGTAPDIAPGAQTWTAHTTWKADGSKSAGGRVNAWLPFNPQPDHVYTVSLDVNPKISGSSDWFSLGFSNGNSTSNWHTSADQVFAWLLNREDDTSGSVVQTFLGPDTASGASHDLNPNAVGWVNLKVVLDTQAAAWTAEWFVNDVSIRGPVAFASNPAINYVGFGAWGSATGVVDNFALTIPEPATLSLLALGGLGLLARRRRG
jgi:hypothetical protein